MKSRTMAAQEASSGSQSGESCALDLPSACDIRDYVLQRPSQEINSETLSSVEFHSFPCSSDVDPVKYFRTSNKCPMQKFKRVTLLLQTLLWWQVQRCGTCNIRLYFQRWN
ncbi:shieldin complex subunit 1 isoform X3 [Sciurus carolinensis]|uniref:shieldin complex subunit 1 isoform X3 n=1 Tax=Sciurus carolinensis TaxID=30640 RepID=UPI001FB41463|nr:shieldin complex subunit 1 isoform X3 [Sciurus carolinensis]